MRSVAVRATASAVVLAMLLFAASVTPDRAAAAPKGGAGAAPDQAAAPQLSIRTRLAVRAREAARVSVGVRAGAGARVAVQTRRDGRWDTLRSATVTTQKTAAFVLRGQVGRVVRLLVTGQAGGPARARVLGRIVGLRRSYASWYGPGFYGNRTACGQRFSANLMGVAHKTLPCGTEVTFRLGSRVVQARVMDRGPFHAGREFDLSPAVKQALRFGSTGTVWVSHR